MNKDEKVSVIIPTRNRAKITIDCLNSVYASSYSNIEVIVVDDASTDNTANIIKDKFPKVKIIKNLEIERVVKSRNKGFSQAGGRYILFLDSDNVIDRCMIEFLVKGYNSHKNVGLIGPKMYFYCAPKRVWFYGAEINMLTGKTTYFGNNRIDNGCFNMALETGHIPNAFMSDRDTLESLSLVFDERYEMHLEEADLAMRIKRSGKTIMVIPEAVTYHKMELPKKNSRSFGFDKERSYFIVRNKALFMKKFAHPLNLIIFMSFFYPLYAVYFICKIFRYQRNLVKDCFKGFKDGYLCLFKLNN